MAFCITCGQQIDEEARYCVGCGAPAHTSSPERSADSPSGVPAGSSAHYQLQPYRTDVQTMGGSALYLRPPKDRRLIWIAGGLILVCVGLVSQFHGSSTPSSSSAYERDDTPPDSNAPSRPEPSPAFSADASPSVVHPNPEDETRQAIGKVMAQDEEASEMLFTHMDGLSSAPFTDAELDSLAKLIRSYVSQARDTSLTDCPRDFAESYFRYVSAWSEAADLLDSHPHIPSEDELALEEFFRSLHGDPTGGAIGIEGTLKAYIVNMRTAFDNVSKHKNEVAALGVRYAAQ